MLIIVSGYKAIIHAISIYNNDKIVLVST
jgi:hypothetical protein